MPEGTSEMYALLVLIFALSISINLWLGALGGRYKHSS
jgi:hypothetical protein